MSNKHIASLHVEPTKECGSGLPFWSQIIRLYVVKMYIWLLKLIQTGNPDAAAGQKIKGGETVERKMKKVFNETLMAINLNFSDKTYTAF